jgi:hypothetical protein
MMSLDVPTTINGGTRTSKRPRRPCVMLQRRALSYLHGANPYIDRGGHISSKYKFSGSIRQGHQAKRESWMRSGNE